MPNRQHSDRNAIDAYKRITSPRYGHVAELAACFAQMGRDAEAREQAAATRKLKPDFAIERYLQTLPYKETADRDHLEEGLRKAGLPDAATSTCGGVDGRIVAP